MTAMVRIFKMRRGLVQIFVRTENSDLASKAATINYTESANKGTFTIHSAKKQLNLITLDCTFANGAAALSAGTNAIDVNLSNYTFSGVVASGASGSTAIIAVPISSSRFVLKVIGGSLSASDTVNITIMLFTN